MTNKYNDTKSGCIEFIKKESLLKITKNSNFYPDPSVEGVWKITNLKCSWGVTTAIIYMAGYKNPWGKIRNDNDFEEVE